MKKDHEELASSSDQETPIDLSTLVIGEVTELTNDLNIFDCRFDVWAFGQWYPSS